MAMAFTEVTSESWFGRIMSSIRGVLFGLLLFIVAFPLLFWGEGRAVKRAADLEAGSSSVTEVSADTIDPAQDGELVHLSGEAKSEEELSDALLGQSVVALRLRRTVEMYQWDEESQTRKTKKLGGGTTKVTTYTYAMQWSESAISSSEFREIGHDNPPMPTQGDTLDAKRVTLGARTLSPQLVGQIDAFTPLTPDPTVASQAQLDGRAATVSGDSFYFGANPSSPELGDLRVSLARVDSPIAISVVAGQLGESFAAWETPDARTFEPRLELGVHSSAEMFAQMNAENASLTWIIRVAGFAMMFIGLMLILKPLVTVADVVPLIGSLIQGGAFLISFAIALPLTLATIAVGWIAYRPLVGIGLLAAAVAIFVGGVMLKRKRS